MFVSSGGVMPPAPPACLAYPDPTDRYMCVQYVSYLRNQISGRIWINKHSLWHETQSGSSGTRAVALKKETTGGGEKLTL